MPWLGRLAAEQGNLDAALRHLTGTAPQDALRLTVALTWFRRLRGLHGDRVPGARALLAAVGEEPPPGLADWPWRAASTGSRWPPARAASGASPGAAGRSPATRGRSSPRPPSGASAAGTGCTGCSAPGRRPASSSG
ncbi:hypothetical protein GCM10010345_48230 [Streptomyces canarius]|uniref:Bacterial transcriptional activator domain-containing protein n=1 Tax=Streptomyces canarius TaxID=285453 RepID=A0ABQ3CU17_9ACTN|nr:hypothetical protein GCM10010345_48230 [Streptomyces canarius]